MHQVVEAIEAARETALDGTHSERDGEVRLADTGRSLQQDGLVLAHIAAGGERLDATAIEIGLEAPVEVGQRVARRQRGQSQRRLHAPLVTMRELDREQFLEESVRRDLVLHRLREEIREDRRDVL